MSRRAPGEGPGRVGSVDYDEVVDPAEAREERLDLAGQLRPGREGGVEALAGRHVGDAVPGAPGPQGRLPVRGGLAHALRDGLDRRVVDGHEARETGRTCSGPGPEGDADMGVQAPAEAERGVDGAAWQMPGAVGTRRQRRNMGRPPRQRSRDFR